MWARTLPTFDKELPPADTSVRHIDNYLCAMGWHATDESFPLVIVDGMCVQQAKDRASCFGQPKGRILPKSHHEIFARHRCDWCRRVCPVACESGRPPTVSTGI